MFNDHALLSSRLTKFFVGLSVCIVLSGCASVDITKTSAGFYDATDPNAVEILKTRPAGNYEELGVITVTGFDSSDTAKMHNAIRAKAATLGSNAVILTEEGMVPKGWGNYERWANGVAVRFKTVEYPSSDIIDPKLKTKHK